MILEYVSSINKIITYYNYDYGGIWIYTFAIGFAIFTFVLIGDCILENKPANTFRKIITTISMGLCILSFITVSSIYVCQSGKGGFSGLLGYISIPVYDVKFEDDAPLKELEERYIILEKSKDFKDSFKIILKDEIDNYTIEKTSSSNIKSLYNDAFKNEGND